jgi:hypothetical protein
MIELAITTDERLLLYKKLYQDSLNYLFEEIKNSESGVDSLSEDNENTDAIKENDMPSF